MRRPATPPRTSAPRDGVSSTRPPVLPVALALAGLACLLVSGIWHAIASAGAVSRDVGAPPIAVPEPTTSPWPVLDLPGVAAQALRDGAPGLPPTELRLPRQAVAGPVLAMGQHSQVLDLPGDPRKLGWWAGGAAPGDPEGSTLLAGHIDSRKRGVGVMAALLKVDLDDPVTVQDGAGRIHRYVVTSRRTYLKTHLPGSLFTTEGEPRLVLVTCAGAFDLRSRHYPDNVVVVAEPV